nr:MAG TPA: hypothetical protein [Caudoviricetes sp.]
MYRIVKNEGGLPLRHQHCKTKHVGPADGSTTEFETTFLGRPKAVI